MEKPPDNPRRERDHAPLMRIGWIGTGVMGASMAGHLLAAGHDVAVHTRTPAKANELLARGASWADCPAAAAEGADAVFSIVGYPQDVEAVHLGPQGTLAASKPPALLIDMTTSRPALAIDIHAAGRTRNVGCLDAPVSGGDVGARNATLSIMIGGDRHDFDAALPLLKLLGRPVVHHGGAGSGQRAKIVNQILIASNMVGVCEGMLFAARAKLDPAAVLESVASGAAGSWSLTNLAPRMINRDFAPGFYVDHFIKDLSIALDEAARLNLELPGLALARRLYESLKAQGHGRSGTHALLLALEHLNSHQR